MFAPDAVIFGLDDRTASECRDRYPDYKAGRAEKHPELIAQLERAGALLDALGLATLTPSGLEADDVNASGATWARRQDWNCVIITSDRDAFAHISDHTQVLRLIDGGIGGSPLLNPARLHDVRQRTTSSTPPFSRSPARCGPSGPTSTTTRDAR